MKFFLILKKIYLTFTFPTCSFSPYASASTQSLSWLNSSSFYYMALYDNRLASWSTFSWLSCSWKVTARNENRFFGFFFFPISSDFCSYYSCFLVFFFFHLVVLVLLCWSADFYSCQLKHSGLSVIFKPKTKILLLMLIH